MADTTLQIYSILLAAMTIALVYSVRFFRARRQRRERQRRITSFESLPTWIGQAVESNRPLHLSLGGASLGESSAVTALASAEFFYHLSLAVRSADVMPIISTSSTAAIPLGQDTLRRARQSGQQAAPVHWHPQGERSLAYAAAVASLLEAEDPAAHVLAGSFGPELALILENAHDRQQATFAVSDQLEGQAAAYAMADEVLIGEELFAAAGYVAADAAAQDDAAVMDVWRSLIILGLSLALLINGAQQLSIAVRALVLLAVLTAFIIGFLVYLRRR